MERRQVMLKKTMLAALVAIVSPMLGLGQSHAQFAAGAGAVMHIGVGNIGNSYAKPSGTFATGTLLDREMAANPDAVVFTSATTVTTAQPRRSSRPATTRRAGELTRL